MGADSWSELTTWREWQRLMTLANLIVVTRPGYEVFVAQADEETAARVVDVRGVTEARSLPALEPGALSVFITDAVMHDVSATQVRLAANSNEDLGKLVPLEVADYIRKYGLYRKQQ
jgi:nicotinate-nucleotide adenylyltransferase